MCSQITQQINYILLALLLLNAAADLNANATVNGLHSTKTAYLDSFTTDQLEFISKHENYLINDCVPEQLYLFVRHGSRYPNPKQVNASRKFLAKAQLANFRVTFEDKPSYGLSDLGRQEMAGIAKRFRQRYPGLFPTDGADLLRDETVSVVSSEKSRCIDSAKSFLQGLNVSVDDKIEAVDRKIVINNKMMRLFSQCERYLQGVDKNHSATVNLFDYKYGKEMMATLDRFRKRHGINESLAEPSLLTKLFTLCQIETAHRMTKNWCNLFESEDYDSLGYYNDLKGFWKKSYGHEEINSNMVFVMLQDLFANMEKHVTEDAAKLKVLLRFGHAENMYPLITALGLFRDKSQLRSDNYADMLERRFKSGRLTPFSANVAFVMHKCGNNNGPKEDNYKVSVLINELPVWQLKNSGKLQCEKGNHICKYSDLKQQLSKYLKTDYDSACSVDPKAKIEL
jgi:multiple inositol-polyphosphate phosphatase/2,3-bisphosphoglycerate 3-phosphatase